jgi:rhamnogalacturonan endolyase
MKAWTLATATAAILSRVLALNPRPLENLGRGVVAIRATERSVLVTWRLLGLDPSDIAFNVYRTSGDDDEEALLNEEPLTWKTNFLDESVDSDTDYSYHVRPIVDG